MPDWALFDIELDEVSFVDKGDNPEAHIVLMKRRGDDEAVDSQPPALTDEEIAKVVGEETPNGVPVAAELRESTGFRGMLRAIGKAFGWTDEQTRAAEEELEKRDFNSYVERDSAEAFFSQASRLCSAYMNSLDDAVYAISGEDPEVPIRDRIARNTEQFTTALSDAAEAMRNDFEVAKASKPSGPKLGRIRQAYRELARAMGEAEDPGDGDPAGQTNKREEDGNLALSEAIRAKLQKGEPLTDEERREVIAADDAMRKSEAPATETPAGDPQDDDAAFEAMTKSLDPGLREYLRKQREEQKRDRAEVAKVAEEREVDGLTKRFAELGLPNAAEMARDADVRKLYRDNADAMSKLDAHMKALGERARVNNRLAKTLAVVGDGSAEDGSALAEATKLAQEKVNKGEFRSIEAARAAVYRENGDLRKRVAAEQEGEVA